MVANKTLGSAVSNGQIDYEFEKNITYEMCLHSIGPTPKHVFLEFPFQVYTAIGTSNEINDGVSLLKTLATEIQNTDQVVQETISRTAIHDQIYSEMETTLYTSFFVKAVVILLVCVLQCWIFMRMVGKKTFEYKRVSIPI